MSAPFWKSTRTTIALVVLSLVTIAIIGVVRFTKQDPPVEMVEVLVASRDLNTGTAFTKQNVEELTRFASIPKSSLSPDVKLVVTKEELIGKRLRRAMPEGGSFDVADLHSKVGLCWEPNKDIMSLPVTSAGNNGLLAEPGSRFDLVGIRMNRKQREVFTVLPDMEVMAINAVPVNPLATDRPPNPDITMVSFQADERQVALIVLAAEASCNLEVLLHRPGQPKSEYDYDKTLALLQALKKQQEETPLEVAPEPRVKAEP